MIDYLKYVLDHLKIADLSVIDLDCINFCGKEAMRILQKKEMLNTDDISSMELLIQISQILYDNSDRSLLVLDDGVYDMLLEKDKMYNQNVQVGGMPIDFCQSDKKVLTESLSDAKEPMEFIDDKEAYMQNQLFYPDIGYATPIYFEELYHGVPSFWELNREAFKQDSTRVNTKATKSVPHKYPNLVGTLDKCKFTLNKEARDKDVFDDPTVKVFERDFLGLHLQQGLFRENDEIELVLELKYDGMSVEADVTDHIISARTRGDTNADLAADLTPVLGGYRFPFVPEMKPTELSFGIKFEAIITKDNLQRLSILKGRSYANARNAIIGLMGSLDAFAYRDLITLVPLATSLDMDRLTEIEFINKYYHSGEQLRYAVVRGNYQSILYQVYKFVKEAEQIRPMMSFMYDGIVVSYTDPAIRTKLGRENFVNKYSMAIKFNTMVKQAVFEGYTWTIGQNGLITPMLNYSPVEFYGGIHTKSSGHSYKRFQELNLCIGDILDLEYRNDVMPYATKSLDQSGALRPDNAIPVEFPTVCPACGRPLSFTDKSAFCVNINCDGRRIARMTNMMKKLNIKDFGSERMDDIAVTSLHELLNLTIDDPRVQALGEANSRKLIEATTNLRTQSIYDYQIVGSLGFSNIAIETWKKILNKIPLVDIQQLPESHLITRLRSIKGIGDSTALTVATERVDFYNDIECILNEMPNVVMTYGVSMDKKTVRFTGVRDPDLCAYLNSIGVDANGDAGVTRKTDILIVPYEGFSSSKIAKAGPSTIIVDIDTFKANIESYLV